MNTLRRMRRVLTRRGFNYSECRIVRFLGKRRRIGTPTAGAIDEASPVAGEPRLIAHPSSIDIAAREPIFLRGWAIDETNRALAWDIGFEIDGKEVPAKVRMHQPRPDVASAFRTPELLTCGFEAILRIPRLPIGPHDIGVRVIVGRRGAAYALLPVTMRFFVHYCYPPEFAPSQMLRTTRWSRVDRILPARSGAILTITGDALDRHRRPFTTVAARIDDGPWHAGWTNINRGNAPVKPRQAQRKLGGFEVRLKLLAIKAGAHVVEVAGKTARGRWMTIRSDQPIIVAAGETNVRPYSAKLSNGGKAAITQVDGKSGAICTYRMKTGVELSLTGTLWRSSPAGAPATLIAQRSDGTEIRLPAWAAPAGEPNLLLFGVTIPEHALSAGTYRLMLEAPDVTQRFIGRADTECDLQVDPDATASASGIDRITASSTISTS